eukprot:1158854-Pelagomonas_calceolata.AAC.1
MPFLPKPGNHSLPSHLFPRHARAQLLITHRFLFLGDGGGGLERYPDDNVLPIGQPPLDAPAAVGACAHLHAYKREDMDERQLRVSKNLQDSALLSACASR